MFFFDSDIARLYYITTSNYYSALEIYAKSDRSRRDNYIDIRNISLFKAITSKLRNINNKPTRSSMESF